MLKCFVVLTAMFPAAVLAATIWTWVDDQGRRHYSDREAPGAVQLEIGDAQTFSGAALRTERPPTTARTAEVQTPTAPVEQQAPGYDIFEVIGPEANENFWNIGGNLPVTLVSFPALAAEHRIDLILDGERQGLGTRSLEILLPEVWRGEHTLEAVIIDPAGTILARSAPVTFHVHQTSVLNQ